MNSAGNPQQCCILRHSPEEAIVCCVFFDPAVGVEAQVYAIPSGRPGKVEVPRAEDLPHV